MDKLEPILKQKFWILLGVGVIMTLVGWWMASGALAKTIAERKTMLDGLEKVIPAGETPNNDWTAKLSVINVHQQRLVDVARVEMWNRQKARMFWPPDVDEYAAELPYHGEFNNIAGDLYRVRYPSDVEKVWKICRPYNPLDGSGIVAFPPEKFPKQLSGNLIPTSKEMWDRQEDLWLLEPLMEAIRNVNGGENATRLDAAVHVIERLELMGGDRSTLSGGAAPAQSFSSSDAGGYDTDVGLLSGSGFGSGFGSGYGQAATPTARPSDFDPREVYGNGGTPVAGLGGFGGFGGSTSSFSVDDGSADAGGGGGVAPTAPVVRRYVDDEESLPYKTRAFYMTVLMDHRKLPWLLAELTANGESAWPIEIGRVQVTRVNPDDGQPGMGVNTGLAMGGYTGSSMSSGYPSGAFGSTANPFATSADATEIYSPPETYADDGSSSGYPSIGGMSRPGGTGFESVLADPFLARVSLCGLIYLYKPVDPPAAPPEASPGETTAQPVADPNALPAESTEPAAAPTPADAPTPTDAPADPAAPPPATEPAAPAAATEPEPAAAPLP
jgi:hypothetical protein